MYSEDLAWEIAEGLASSNDEIVLDTSTALITHKGMLVEGIICQKLY